MKVKCKNCAPEEGIEVPDFSQSEKNKIHEIVLEARLYAVKYIVEDLGLGRRDAKYIVTHVNSVYGHCNRCTFDKLDEEYITCPKCGALNFNWKTDVVSI